MKLTLKAMLCAAFVLSLSACQGPDFSRVSTQQGQVVGDISADLITFKGIPYAAPPVDELRWRAPQPALTYSDPLIADEFGNKCMQRPSNQAQQRKPEQYTQPESEDCLYLNIYRPNNSEKDLPVMVWIPGGGLVNGSGSRPVNHGGQLAQHDVIVVAINYRLGAFGFFAHPQLSAANPDEGRLFNYGLMDQIAALQWVQDNIAQFGGNPDNVTLFGESAGAYSVDALVATQSDKGLFHKAISQSGYGRGAQPRVASLVKEDSRPAIETMGVALATQLGDSDMTLGALRSTPAEDIVKATNFSSFIEFAVDGTVIPTEIETLYTSGKQASVPLLIGANDFEFGMVPQEAQRNIMSPLLPADAMTALTAFYGDEQLRDTMLYSDYVFHSQARLLAQAQEQLGNAVYVYRFAMPGQGMPSFEDKSGKVWGAPHAADLPYVFGNFTGDHGEPDSPDSTQQAISEQIMSYWTNFAKTGSPNGPGLPQWPPYKGETILHISPEGAQAQSDKWIPRLDAINQYFTFK